MSDRPSTFNLPPSTEFAHGIVFGLEPERAGLRELTLDCRCGARRLAVKFLRAGDELADAKSELGRAWAQVLPQHVAACRTPSPRPHRNSMFPEASPAPLIRSEAGAAWNVGGAVCMEEAQGQGRPVSSH